MAMLLSVKDESAGKDYVFIEELGRGSFGTCYMAVEEASQKYHACKICTGKKVASEIDIHSKLSHGNIVKLLCSFRFEKSSCMIMELCMNGTVDLLLKCRKNLTDPEVRFLTRQVVQGMQYLHENLIIHRDLKLTNLLLSSSMVVKIGDFGLSKRLTHPDEKRVTVCGTKGYVAPEVTGSVGHGFEVDIWALGVIVYTLLDGKEPFTGRNNKGTSKNMPRLPRSSSANISQKCRALLNAIFVEPQKRPTALTVLDHPYYCSGITPDTLDFTVYYQKPIFEARSKKFLPLRDVTNCAAKCELRALRYPGGRTGKENETIKASKESTFKMALRPRKDKTLPMKAFQDVPFMKSSIEDGGAQIARSTLDALRSMLQRSESKVWSLKKKECSFVCVRRWIAGLAAFGYHLNNGSLGAHFPNGMIVHRASGYTEIYNEADNFVRRYEGNKVLGGLGRLLRYFDSCLNSLDGTGPECFFSNPIVVVSKKFFPPDAELSHFARPKVAFVLSNGSCQMNFADHEKLLVNKYDDFVVRWNGKDSYVCSLSELEARGIPAQLKTLVELMCFFLALVQQGN